MKLNGNLLAVAILIYFDLILSGGILKTSVEGNYAGFTTLVIPTLLVFLLICSVPGITAVGKLIYGYADKTQNHVVRTIIYGTPLWMVLVIGVSLQFLYRFINETIANIGNSLSSIAELLLLPFIVVTLSMVLIFASLNSYKKRKLNHNNNHFQE